jgi:hypothetical protein
MWSCSTHSLQEIKVCKIWIELGWPMIIVTTINKGTTNRTIRPVRCDDDEIGPHCDESSLRRWEIVSGNLVLDSFRRTAKRVQRWVCRQEDSGLIGVLFLCLLPRAKKDPEKKPAQETILFVIALSHEKDWCQSWPPNPIIKCLLHSSTNARWLSSLCDRCSDTYIRTISEEIVVFLTRKAFSL